MDDRMHLSPAGEIARTCWVSIPLHFPHVVLDEFTVQPDHVHGILSVGSKPAVKTEAVQLLPSTEAVVLQVLQPSGFDGPYKPAFGPQPAGSLPAIIRAYKAAVTRLTGHKGSLWQSLYHDAILRDPSQLARVRAYVRGHPPVQP